MLKDCSIFVIAESHLRRTTLREMLRKLLPAAVVNVGSTLSIHEVQQSGPDLLIADLESDAQAKALPGLLAELPSLAGSVALLDHPTSAWVRQALRAGVNAIIARDSHSEDLRLALEAADAGFVLLHPSSSQRLIQENTFTLASWAEGDYIEQLTSRELEVLRLMGDGLGNKEIATRLGMSEHTAKFHASSILGKLGAVSRTEAVSIGIRRGLIPI